jgi:hypothetical protein
MSTGSSTGRPRESTVDAALHWPHSLERALELPWRGDERRRWWERAGVSPRGERAFDLLLPAVLATLAVGWTWSIVNAKKLARADGELEPVAHARAVIASALPTSKGPRTAYLTDAALTGITERMLESARGTSGKLRATIQSSPAPLTHIRARRQDSKRTKGGRRLECSACDRQCGSPSRQLQRHHDASVQREAERQSRPVLRGDVAE